MELNDINPQRSLDWLKNAVEALAEHRENTQKGYPTFIRSSESCSPKEAGEEPRNDANGGEQEKASVHFFPTATFHAYAALADAFGFLEELGEADFLKKIGGMLSLTPDKSKYAAALRDRLFDLLRGCDATGLTKSSANSRQRSIILWEALLNAVERCPEEKDRNREGIELPDKAPIEEPIKNLISTLIGDSDSEKPTIIYPDPPGSPWFILTALNCKRSLGKIGMPVGESFPGEKELRDKTDRHIDYQMARSGLGGHSFDPVSLAIAVCCKLRLDKEFRHNPLFVECLRKIFACQQPDGCWPTGAAISLHDSGDVIQQPSIALVTELIEAIVDYDLLVAHSEQSQRILELVTPLFQRLARFLETTYSTAQRSDASPDDPVTIHGWCSDRLRLPYFTETWITAYVCRFLLRYHLLEKACLRSQALRQLGVPGFTPGRATARPKGTTSDGDGHSDWEKILEPDDILTPKSEIEALTAGLVAKCDNGNSLRLCEKDHVSFIVCGPPGSGKTHLVTQLAARLDWPLVELSPSHFIRNGMEFIESTSKEVFDALMQLFHAVVFFDECDELFCDRTLAGNNRNILMSFLTPCMLPKLQKLHDCRQVIFVVGTNFLHRMDKAIIRSGRFDKKLLYDLPDEACRTKIYKQTGQTGQLNDFLAQTRGLPYKEVEKYKVTGQCAPVLPADYSTWIENIAQNEIKECSYNEYTKNAKQAYWDDLMRNNPEQTEKPASVPAADQKP